MKFVDKIDIYIYLIQYSIFLMLKLFETSGIKFIKLRIRINFIVSSSGLPEYISYLYIYRYIYIYI